MNAGFKRAEWRLQSICRAKSRNAAFQMISPRSSVPVDMVCNPIVENLFRYAAHRR
jgi:hypothetical protein